MKVAIIGTGKIGTDLLHKLRNLRDEIEIVGFVGRRNVHRLEPEYTSEGINFFINNPKCCDVVFDCTDAQSAKVNNVIFSSQGIRVIDLTPSKQGFMCVPNVNCDYAINYQNISMITCGGQVSIPLIYFLSRNQDIEYVEVITQVSSESVGMATRINIDEYIHTTEHAIEKLTGTRKAKVILNINPSQHVHMKTTVLVKLEKEPDLNKFEDSIRAYIPKYRIGNITRMADGVVSIPSYIENSHDELPGNLDVINRSAVKILMGLKLNGCRS